MSGAPKRDSSSRPYPARNPGFLRSLYSQFCPLRRHQPHWGCPRSHFTWSYRQPTVALFDCSAACGTQEPQHVIGRLQTCDSTEQEAVALQGYEKLTFLSLHRSQLTEIGREVRWRLRLRSPSPSSSSLHTSSSSRSAPLLGEEARPSFGVM